MKKIPLMLLLVLIILGIGCFSYYAFYLLQKPNEVTPLVWGAIGFAISKVIENQKESKARLYDKKQEVYLQMIKPYREFITSTAVNREGGSQKQELVLTKEQISGIVEAAFNAITFASDDVIKAYGRYRSINYLENYDSDLSLRELARFLKAVRRDLGSNYTSVDEVDLLKMFINMTVLEEQYYRAKFRSLP